MAMQIRFPLIAAAAVALIAAFPGRGLTQDATPVIDPAAFSPIVTNPFFPLASVRYRVYLGEEEDSETGETVETLAIETVLDETHQVAGVEVAVVEVKEYEDGELTELTRDYYAQHADGTVYYFGEDVDNYEDGQVVDHEGAWLAGEGENQPGTIMPATPEVGVTFQTEIAPGVAEDQATIVELDQTTETAAGHFAGCLLIEEVNPLEGGAAEDEYYCPGVGSVREEFEGGFQDLVYFEAGSAPELEEAEDEEDEDEEDEDR